MKRFLKVIECTQELQVRDNVVGFEKALGAVEVIKDQIQYRSQSFLNLARGYFRENKTLVERNKNRTKDCVDKVIIWLYPITYCCFESSPIVILLNEEDDR